jgi:hypothetical protein
MPTKVQKPFWKAENKVLFVNFGQFPRSWIRICLFNTDPDPRQPNECRSRWIRTHNTMVNWLSLCLLYVFLKCVPVYSTNICIRYGRPAYRRFRLQWTVLFQFRLWKSFGSGSGSGSRQFLARFSNKQIGTKPCLFNVRKAALFPRKLASLSV